MNARVHHLCRRRGERRHVRHVRHAVPGGGGVRRVVEDLEALVHAQRGDRVLVVLPREVAPVRAPRAVAPPRERQVIRHGRVRVPVLLAAEGHREPVRPGHRAPVRADPRLFQLVIRERREALGVRGLLELPEDRLEHAGARRPVRPLRRTRGQTSLRPPRARAPPASPAGTRRC